MSVHIVQRLKQSVTLRTLYVRVTIHSPVLTYELFCLIYTWYTFRIKRWLRQLCVDTLLESYCRTYWISKLTQYYYMVSEVRVTFNDGFYRRTYPQDGLGSVELPRAVEKNSAHTLISYSKDRWRRKAKRSRLLIYCYGLMGWRQRSRDLHHLDRYDERWKEETWTPWLTLFGARATQVEPYIWVLQV